LLVFVSVAPSIDRSSFRPELKLKAGRDFNVEIRFAGIPTPTASWARLDGKVIQVFLLSFFRYWPTGKSLSTTYLRLKVNLL